VDISVQKETPLQMMFAKKFVEMELTCRITNVTMATIILEMDVLSYVRLRKDLTAPGVSLTLYLAM